MKGYHQTPLDYFVSDEKSIKQYSRVREASGRSDEKYSGEEDALRSSEETNYLEDLPDVFEIDFQLK